MSKYKETVNGKRTGDGVVGRSGRNVLAGFVPFVEGIILAAVVGLGVSRAQEPVPQTKTEQTFYSFSFVTGQQLTASDLKKAFSGGYCSYWDVKDTVSSGGYWDNSSGDSIWVDFVSLKRVYIFEIANLSGACTLQTYQRYMTTPDFIMTRSDDYLVTSVVGFGNRNRTYNYDILRYKGRGTEILSRHSPDDPRGSHVDGVGVIPIVSDSDTVGIAVLYRIVYMDGGTSYFSDLFFTDTKTVVRDKLIKNLK
jgi:hypothetical protein